MLKIYGLTLFNGANPVNRKEKEALVVEMQDVFQSTAIVVITHNQGLTVADSTLLRNQMRAAGASYKVVKNRVVKRALAGTQFEPLDSYFTGPTAIAWSDDPVSAAKVAVDFAKKNDKLQLVSACFDGSVLDVAQLKTLASLPSLDELRATLVGLLQAPAGKLAQLSSAPAAAIARQISAYAEAQK